MSLITKLLFLNNLTIVSKLCDWKNVRTLELATAQTYLESPFSGSINVNIPFLPMTPSGSTKVCELGELIKLDSIKSLIFPFSAILNEKLSFTA
jgi:hypothetical protein